MAISVSDAVGDNVIATSARAPNDASIPQPRIVQEVIHIPVVEGGGLRLRRISTADGLSQTRVTDIVQDDQGFMWFGTQYGLNRYDGYDFKLFVHDPSARDSLSGTFVTALFKDRTGMLWIGTGQALDRLDPKTETFTHFRIDPADTQTPEGTVVHISQDRNGFLWLATGAGLQRLDPASGNLIHFRHDPTNPRGLPSNDVNWTGEDSSGRFWVSTSDGLDEFDRATGLITYHVPITEAVRTSFFEDSRGNFWITYASGNGLALLDRAANTLTRYSFYRQEPSPSDLTGVMGIAEDKDGDLWLGSPGFGLLRFDRAKNAFVHYGHRPEDPQTIAEDKVIALFADRSGSIWAGLHSKGPNVLARSAMAFETFRHVPDLPNSLTLDFVNALYEDSQGFLWIGNDDGLNRIDRHTGVRTAWTGGLGSKPMVITIVEDPAGFIWFGTFGHGLGRLDPRSGRVTSYRHDPSNPRSLSNDEVHRLLVDRSGTLWVGTDDGLDRFDPVHDDFTVYKVDWNSRRSQSYVAMTVGNDGTLWLGSHYSGLHHFDPAKGTFTIYRSIPGDTESLRDNMIPTVYANPAGIIWVGTQNGLNRLDPASGRLSSFNVSDALAGNTVSCILEDGTGHLWMSTNRGLFRFNPHDGTFVNYSQADGLPGNDFTGWGACHRGSRGELLFGGFAGAVAFVPERLQDSSSIIPVVLTEFQLSGSNVEVGPDSPLKRPIAYSDRVTLSHAQSVFSVAFAGLNFLNPEATRYRYRLDGLDQAWTEVDSRRRRVTYSTLPPGIYWLRVQAATARGPWNGPTAVLGIEILPPWWATWWFRSLCALSLLLAGVALYRLRMRQITQHVSIRMQERMDERTRIARELHDSLLQGAQGLILRLQAVRDMLPGHPREAAAELERALDRGDQALAEARDAVTGIRGKSPQSGDLISALRSLSKEIPDVGLARPSPFFRVLVEGRPRPLRELIRDDLYQIAREAFRNAVKHSNGNNVEIKLCYSNGYFELHVRDDGGGIHSGAVSKRMDEGHWGIQGMRERAASMGGQLQIWSEQNAGTEIQVKLPAAVAYSDPGSGARWIQGRGRTGNDRSVD